MRSLPPLLLATALASTALPVAAWSQSAGDRISRLEQEIQLLKRQQEVQEEKNAAAAEKAALVELGKSGLKITSPNKKYELSLKGTYQVDGRQFLNDEKNTGKDDFVARRIRPTLEGKAGDASFRLMPDFGGSSPALIDAHVDYKVNNAVQFRFGKFKTPVSLERLQSSADLEFIERGHPSNLAPNRDIGFMLYGNPVADVIEYQIGVFNGNADLGNTNSDDDDKKDLAVRIFTQPFRNSDIVSLQGFGIGVGGTIGDREGNENKPILGSYKTPGQQDFFKYSAGTYADGQHWRLYPQAYWYTGNIGFLAEYAISNQEVSNAANHADLEHTAWQFLASYVLTGEDVNFKGSVKPFRDFSLSNGGLGAWEVAARVGSTDVDDKAFSGFASAVSSASKATSYGGGLGWYLSENLKLAANYDFTNFEGGAAGGKDRPNEHALFTRAQFRF